ncbi:MAG: hypothetical protein Tsb009_26450 [Planctomycetaceae bacterium]
MKKFVLGVIFATIAMYLWGFLYWGINSVPYEAWKKTPDDAAAGEALLKHFPEDGTYHIPGPHHEEKVRNQLYEQGPVAMVHITSREGRPAMDPSIMVQGFLLNLLVVFLLALLLKQVSGAIPSYFSRIRFFAFLGVIAALFVDGGDAVWWGISWEWKIFVAIYDASAIVIAGLVLSNFVAVPSKA